MRTSTTLLALLGANSAFGAAVFPRHKSTSQLDDAHLLLADGTTQSIRKEELSSLLPGVHLSDPALTNPRPLHLTSNTSSRDPKLAKRADTLDLIIEIPEERFLGWDIAMSTVTYANQEAATIAIMSGQFVANGVTVGTGVDLTLVKDFLTVSGSVDYTHTVTSTLSGTVTMTIPENRWGAIVSNPMTLRRQGYVFSGSPGNGGEFGYYKGDSMEDQTYEMNGGELSWVKGVVTTCLGDAYPLKRCRGEGSLE
jgi:hypothetical protein